MNRMILASLAALALSGCGSAPEEPVEQIVVRQPGAATPAAVPAAAPSAAPTATPTG